MLATPKENGLSSPQFRKPKLKQHGTSSAKKSLGCSISWQMAHVRAYTGQSNHAVRHEAGKGSEGQAFSFIAILSGGY